jgi:ADP-heptose:LPS heptosyltransferase
MVMLNIKGGLGDELGVTAAVREIKRQKPDEMVQIRGGSHREEVWRNNPYLNIGNADDGRMVHLFSFMKQTKETQNSRSVHYMKLIGLDLSKVVDEYPEIYYTAEELAEPIMVAKTREKEEKRSHPLADEIPEELIPRLVSVDPGAGWPTRVWEEDRWHVLCEDLRDRGHILVQVGSEGRRPLRGIHYNLVGRLNLRNAGRFLRLQRLYIGSDSGFYYLAAAVGAAHVCIYSVTRYASGPYPTTVPVVPRVECAPACFQLCKRSIPGSPQIQPCINEITVADVLGAVDIALPRPKPENRIKPCLTAAEVDRLFHANLQEIAT